MRFRTRHVYTKPDWRRILACQSYNWVRVARMKDLDSDSFGSFEWGVWLADLILIELAGHAAAHIHFGVALWDAAPVHTIFLHFCAVAAVLIFRGVGIYDSWRGRRMLAQYLKLAVILLVVLMAGLMFSFLIRQVGTLSRIWVFYWYAGALTLLVTSRILIHAFLRNLRRRGLNVKRVLFIGCGSTGREMYRRVMQQKWSGYEVSGVFVGSENDDLALDPAIARIPSLEEVPRWVQEHHVSEVWIMLSLSDTARLQHVQYLLRNELIDIRWVPDLMSVQILGVRPCLFLGMPVVDLNHALPKGVNGLTKEIFDKMVALFVLLLLLPLFVVIAVGIKCSSPGPVLFRQPRLGLNGKRFEVYKFRSMVVHREDGLVIQATRNDSRVTPFGAFLRRTSLDELPQFMNVLRGEMSVVGPRPHALPHNETYKNLIDRYMMRHRVKPGITGWAQINGCRGETDSVDKMARRVELDLNYIQQWSLWLDIRIVVWTALRGWTSVNAY